MIHSSRHFTSLYSLHLTSHTSSSPHSTSLLILGAADYISSLVSPETYIEPPSTPNSFGKFEHLLHSSVIQALTKTSYRSLSLAWLPRLLMLLPSPPVSQQPPLPLLIASSTLTVSYQSYSLLVASLHPLQLWLQALLEVYWNTERLRRLLTLTGPKWGMDQHPLFSLLQFSIRRRLPTSWLFL